MVMMMMMTKIMAEIRIIVRKLETPSVETPSVETPSVESSSVE